MGNSQGDWSLTFDRKAGSIDSTELHAALPAMGMQVSTLPLLSTKPETLNSKS